MRQILLGCIACLLAACAGTPQGTDRADDIAALTSLSETWTELYIAGDFDAMRELYEPDAVLMTRDRPVRRGRDAILTYFADTRQPELTSTMTFDVEDTLFETGFAFQTSLWWFEGHFPDGRSVRDSGRSFLIYKQGPTGVWRIWRDIDNHTPDAVFKDESK